jgi:hypothetical protein
LNRRIKAWRFVCAVLSPTADAATISQLRNNIGTVERLWPDVFRFTDAHLVTPAFFAALTEKGLIPDVPNEPQQYMASIYELNACRNRCLSTQLDEAIGALNGCGIVPVLLKGASYLKERIYKDPATRIFSDLDLLIGEAEIPLAVETLDGIGYRATQSGMEYTRHRHAPPMFRPGEYGCIELHRRCVGKDLEHVLQADAVWKASVEKKREGLHYRVLSPTHMVMLSFLHSQLIDRFGETFTIGLRSLLDLLALDSACGVIQWDEIYARLMERNLQNRLRDYLFIAHRMSGFRVPEIRFGGREWAHYGISVTRIRWPKVDRLINRLPVFIWTSWDWIARVEQSFSGTRSTIGRP